MEKIKTELGILLGSIIDIMDDTPETGVLYKKLEPIRDCTHKITNMVDTISKQPSPDSRSWKDDIIEAMMLHMDTRDKRYMFLKVVFIGWNFENSIRLDGSTKESAWNIYNEFNKNNMLGSLVSHINAIFSTELIIKQ